jgi:hypothetical protein
MLMAMNEDVKTFFQFSNWQLVGKETMPPEAKK